MSIKKATKKQLPKFDSAALPTDFFSSTESIILDSVNRSAQGIEALHQVKLEKKDISPNEKQTSQLKPKGRGEDADKNKARKRESKKDEDDFLAFLTEGRSRKNTRPVRVRTSIIDRFINLRDGMGGSIGVPEMIDKVLEMYLDKAEKQKQS